MRALPLTVAATAIALSPVPDAAMAQDFVGFSADSFGNVVLKRNQVVVIDREDGSTPASTSPSDTTNEPITNYSPESVFAEMGKAVGRLDILTDKGVFPCTAFIVDEDHVLTNYHCIPGIREDARVGASRIDAALFWTGYTNQGVSEGARSYTVLPQPVESSEPLDYAVLRVIGNPAAEYGTLELSGTLPHDGDPYWVIGHPLGEAQRISREKCRANRPAVSGDRLLHTCNTLPGNSGSPVIDATSQQVVGLHHAGSGSDQVNFAIPMQAILEHSQVLEASTGYNTPDVITPPDVVAGATANLICDKLYEKAEALDQCYAYEAYLETCGEHPFAILAKGYVAGQCNDAPAVTYTPPTNPPVQPPVTQTPTPLRPWCTSSRLNATEAAICADPYLAGLDADLDAAYRNPARSVTTAQQGAWRTGTRDACGANTSCIARVVIDRVTYLRTPAPSAPSSGSSGARPGNYTLSSSCYVVVASRPSQSEATAYIQANYPGRPNIRMFLSQNGWYAVAVETTSRASSDARLNQLKSAGHIPYDSYCSTGQKFTHEIAWSSGGSTSGNTTGQTTGQTMYIDNTSSLNVRAGPGTEYGRITAVDRGTAVTVLGYSGDWANVRAGGFTGWVSANYLSSSKPSVQAQCYGSVVNVKPYNSATRSNGSGFLNIRSAPSTRGTILSEVYLGDTVRVFTQSNGWAQIRCVQGQCLSPYVGQAGATGWASAKYLAVRCN